MERRMSHRRVGQQRLHAPRWPSSRPVPFLKRCSSMPSGLFLKTGQGGGEGDGRSFDEGRVLFRGHTSTDVLSPCSSSPHGSEECSKDAKVVVNVTVEGSPGPIRTMVRLGCSVEDAIVAVVDRYGHEGRMPRLDRDAVTGYELHHSYFSLQSLEKSELIGNVGSRSFYLRTSSNNTVILPGSSEAMNPPPVIPPLLKFLMFVANKFRKIVRRVWKLWKIVICSR